MTHADDEIRRAFVARATAAVDRLAAELPRRVIARALAAPTDIGMLARALQDELVVEAMRGQGTKVG